MAALTSSVAWWARPEPARIALCYGDQRVTYAELYRRACRVAGALRARGVRPGDVVAVLMKNSAAFVEIALATSHLGAVLLPVNYRLSAAEVGYIADHAGAVLLFVDEELAASAAGAAARIVVDAAAQADASRLAGNVTAVDTPHASDPQDLFRLMYTSGTTDRPKGVMHTYDNYVWKCLDHVGALGLAGDDRLLVVGPLYHVGAFDLPGLALLLVGGMLVVLRDFDAEATLSLVERERITGAWMAPVMLTRTLAAAPARTRDLTSLRWVVGGGDRTPEGRIREFTSVFPRARYIDAYGLTETCSGDTMMQAGREIEKIGSAGRALAHVDIEIRDDEGAPLPAGSTGEICLRGPKVTQGYWKDPERTAASRHGEWFRTGDVGHLDADGFLFLTDRKKDMIISGGENIASAEIERVLQMRPEIEDVAVIGVPDAQWGERPLAVVVLRAGATLDATALNAHCLAHLARFKVPKDFVARPALPRNPSGKLLKRVLREEFSLAS